MKQRQTPITKLITIVLLTVITLFAGCNNETPSIVAVSSVEIQKPERTTLAVGETLQLNAVVRPDNATDKTVIWSSSDDNLAIVENGEVTALAAGEVSITAKAGSVESDPLKIKVVDKPITVESITLNESGIELIEGQSFSLIATINPDDATYSVIWRSSSSSVATVNEEGVVTAVSAGETEITATAGDKSATCTVVVKVPAVKLQEISIRPEKLLLDVDGEGQLVAVLNPAGASADIKWSVEDESIVTINENGLVKAVKAGTTKVTATATAGDITVTDSCEVIVEEGSETVNISFDKTSMTLTPGKSENIVLTAPEGVTVEWGSGNTEVATVDAHGVVTAVGVGETIIFASTAEGATASCIVTVEAVEVSTIKINAAEQPENLKIGDVFTLTALIEPENATDKTVRWSSDNERVAVVDDGKVEIVGVGVANVTVTSNSNSAASDSVTIEVKPIAVTSVILDRQTLELTVGTKETLKATVLPEDATDTNVVWTTSDEFVATVNNGVVTAVSEGKAAITATAGDKSATCEVTVKLAYIPVNKIAIDTTSVSLSVGESATLKATVEPDNATDVSIEWSSSNDGIVSVDSNGKITAKAIGKATIIAKAGDKTASCEVTVNAPVSGGIIEPEGINPDDYSDIQQFTDADTALQEMISTVLDDAGHLLYSDIPNLAATTYAMKNPGVYADTRFEVESDGIKMTAVKDIVIAFEPAYGSGYEVQIVLKSGGCMSTSFVGGARIIETSVEFDGDEYNVSTDTDGQFVVTDNSGEPIYWEGISSMIGNVSGLWMLKVMTVILNDEIIGKGPIEINNIYITGDAVISISKHNLDTSEVDAVAVLNNYKVIDGAPGAPDAEKTYSSKGLRFTASSEEAFLRGPLTYEDNEGETHEFYFDVKQVTYYDDDDMYHMKQTGYIVYNNTLYDATYTK